MDDIEISSEEAFTAPWHAQIFALTVARYEAGAFTWSRWARELYAEIEAGNDGKTSTNDAYWAAWLRAFENLLVADGATEPRHVSALARAWKEAAMATPHGEPIVLNR